MKADIVSAIDDKLLVTWDALQWTWTNGPVAQRVSSSPSTTTRTGAVPGADGWLGPTLNTMFNVLFRGNSAAYGADPNLKDDQLLTEFAHGLVRAQLEPLGVKP